MGKKIKPTQNIFSIVDKTRIITKEIPHMVKKGKAPHVIDFYDDLIVKAYQNDHKETKTIGTVSIDPKSLSNPNHKLLKYSYITSTEAKNQQIPIIDDVQVEFDLELGPEDNKMLLTNKRIMVAHWSGNPNININAFKRTIIGGLSNELRIRVLCVPKKDIGILKGSPFYKHLKNQNHFYVYSYKTTGIIGGTRREVATFSIMRESMKRIVKSLAQKTRNGNKARLHCMMVDLDVANELHADLAMHSDDGMSDNETYMPVRQHFRTDGVRHPYENLRETLTADYIKSNSDMQNSNGLLKIPTVATGRNTATYRGRPAEQAVSVSYDSKYFYSLASCGEDQDMEAQGKLWLLEKYIQDNKEFPIINRNQFGDETGEPAISKVDIFENHGLPNAEEYNKLKVETNLELIKLFNNLIFEFNWGQKEEDPDKRVTGTASEIGKLVHELVKKYHESKKTVYKNNNKNYKGDVPSENAKTPSAVELANLIMTRGIQNILKTERKKKYDKFKAQRRKKFPDEFLDEETD